MSLSDQWYTTNQNGLQDAIMACDLGGSKFAYGLFSVDSKGQIDKNPLVTRSCPTPKGKSALALVFTDLVSRCLSDCQSKRLALLPHIGIGSPGILRLKKWVNRLYTSVQICLQP